MEKREKIRIIKFCVKIKKNLLETWADWPKMKNMVS